MLPAAAPSSKCTCCCPPRRRRGAHHHTCGADEPARQAAGIFSLVSCPLPRPGDSDTVTGGQDVTVMRRGATDDRSLYCQCCTVAGQCGVAVGTGHWPVGRGARRA